MRPRGGAARVDDADRCLAFTVVDLHHHPRIAGSDRPDLPASVAAADVLVHAARRDEAALDFAPIAVEGAHDESAREGLVEEAQLELLRRDLDPGHEGDGDGHLGRHLADGTTGDGAPMAEGSDRRLVVRAHHTGHLLVGGRPGAEPIGERAAILCPRDRVELHLLPPAEELGAGGIGLDARGTAGREREHGGCGSKASAAR